MPEEELTPIEAKHGTLIPINSIAVSDGRRAINQTTVNELVGSIERIGLLSPIVVAKRGEKDFVLVAGRHRLEACRMLRFDEIACRLIDAADATRLELAEIDENFVRHNLSPAEEAELVTRRADLFSQIAEKENALSQIATAQRQAKRGAGIETGPEAASIRDMAKKTGQSKDKIGRSARRGRSLGARLLEKVRGTSLDKGVELDALIELPEADRAELANRAAAGEAVSARATRDGGSAGSSGIDSGAALRDLQKWRSRYGSLPAIAKHIAPLDAIEAALAAAASTSS